ncbi:MAG: hypothetical protein GTN62_07270 [Gemmatimonadales bacterium]|nr:hypothetical protein [Gemmatimonadales bacterium]NIN11300.1 hypothetical protein [Gemmatimonadales bacterium]NIN49899.1 hypothetical protein [Gemmatimonadales bacterium]NIP07363.1 hypothetical protein [Gemmatimonadales bacterium]NIR03058.1 hypothetical protein [Gemmatimonadales bacterium]
MPCPSSPTVLLVAASLLWPGSAATAQRVIDRGALIIMDGTRVIGREEFVVRQGRGPGAADGFTVSGTASYPAEQPTRTLVGVVEFGPDSQPAAARFDAEDGGLQRVLVRFGRRRVTVRIATRSGESTREFPGAPRHLVLDDSLFGYHALSPAGPPGPVRSISPRQGRRTTAQLADHGMDRTMVGRVERVLRHLTVRTGNETRHLWYDDRGRLTKLAIPSRRLVAVRAVAAGR